MPMIPIGQWRKGPDVREWGLFSCPACGPEEPYVRYEARWKLYLLWFLPIPMPWATKWVTCASCGRYWKPAALKPDTQRDIALSLARPWVLTVGTSKALAEPLRREAYTARHPASQRVYAAAESGRQAELTRVEGRWLAKQFPNWIEILGFRWDLSNNEVASSDDGD